jgi:hypothetical protein
MPDLSRCNTPGKNIPNDQKMYQTIPFGRKIDNLAPKIPTSSNARLSKIYANWNFLV